MDEEDHPGESRGGRWGLAAAFLAAPRTSGDRSGGGEGGGGARRWVAVGGPLGSARVASRGATRGLLPSGNYKHMSTSSLSLILHKNLVLVVSYVYFSFYLQ
jgi:hypothetical protein